MIILIPVRDIPEKSHILLMLMYTFEHPPDVSLKEKGFASGQNYLFEYWYMKLCNLKAQYLML